MTSNRYAVGTRVLWREFRGINMNTLESLRTWSPFSNWQIRSTEALNCERRSHHVRLIIQRNSPMKEVANLVVILNICRASEVIQSSANRTSNSAFFLRLTIRILVYVGLEADSELFLLDGGDWLFSCDILVLLLCNRPYIYLGDKVFWEYPITVLKNWLILDCAESRLCFANAFVS